MSCFHHSKILTRPELPSSELKGLSQKNGDIHHSTEKLPNGTEAPTSEKEPKAAASESKLKPPVGVMKRQETTWSIRMITSFLLLALRYASFPPLRLLPHLLVESGDHGDDPAETHLLHGGDEQDAGVHGHPRPRAP